MSTLLNSKTVERISTLTTEFVHEEFHDRFDEDLEISASPVCECGADVYTEYATDITFHSDDCDRPERVRVYFDTSHGDIGYTMGAVYWDEERSCQVRAQAVETLDEDPYGLHAVTAKGEWIVYTEPWTSIRRDSREQGPIDAGVRILQDDQLTDDPLSEYGETPL